MNRIIAKNYKSNVYIVDFLNIFSDFREIKYKKDNIDFHSVKHCNKEQDTYDFFKLFFSKYIDYVQIEKTSKFYFVMKKLNDYENILDNIMKTHSEFNMRFIIIEDKYDNIILDPYEFLKNMKTIDYNNCYCYCYCHCYCYCYCHLYFLYFLNN